ncbi:DUF3800 domain-containing protein [Jeotgalicoccus huakuii]|uniref:DUF3800 domain-containing protein n=1 Tax=Jeotgalicoccus TaxID=227979 RepID=UPI000409138B|nr:MULTISPECIES: DUF3800 domain-containing protein [Jeotgalicoccus]MCK1977008.1 DUF3800 domain-containing protein [Jeotgalicoccus huakuii]
MDKFIFIDDSGQLSNNERHEYFIYGCLYVDGPDAIQEAKNKVNAFCRKRKIKGEIKGFHLSGKDRKKLLQILGEIDGIKQYFVMTKNSELKFVNFKDPASVKRHKQYLIRRMIEKVFRKETFTKEDVVHLRIDNEVFNSEAGLVDFEHYLNKYWSKLGEFYSQQFYWDFMPYILSQFKVKYLDSKDDRMIQLADLIANTKYKRFKDNPKCGSEYLKTKYCLKLPDKAVYNSPKTRRRKIEN